MRIESTIFIVGIALLAVAAVRWKLPKTVMKLWMASLVILLLWISFIDGIAYERNSEWVGKNVVFNRPMAYIKNFNRHVYDTKSDTLNRVLSPLEQTYNPWFHNYKNGVKDIEYVESDTSYTVISSYRSVPALLSKLFSSGFRMHILEDEHGVVSTISDLYLEDSKRGYEGDKEFIEEVYFLDDAKRDKSTCVLKAFIRWDKTGKTSEASIISNLRTYIAFYGGQVTELRQGQGVEIKGDADVMAFVYSSKVELGISKILDNTDCWPNTN